MLSIFFISLPSGHQYWYAKLIKNRLLLFLQTLAWRGHLIIPSSWAQGFYWYKLRFFFAEAHESLAALRKQLTKKYWVLSTLCTGERKFARGA
jgi:hypothetical protein